MKHVAFLAVAALLLTGCGTDPSGAVAPRAPFSAPTAVPAADGPVQTRSASTVLDDGDGAELCVGGGG